MTDATLAPCFHQKDTDIERYYRNVPVGGLAAMRLTQYQMLQYIITLVLGRRPGKVYLENATGFGGNAFYTKSGKNFREPTGQTRLVVPTEDVLAFVAAHPGGDLLALHPMIPKHIRPGLFMGRDVERCRTGIAEAVDRALSRAADATLSAPRN